MLLHELIDGWPVEVVAGDVNAPVLRITDDSRQVTAGCLFVARRGSTDDGMRYVDDARQRGAVAIITCDTTTTAHLAERFFGDPSKKLRLIGITGTNGKTTTAYMVRHLLNGTGCKCGMLTTVEVDVGDGEPQAATLTTPGAIQTSRLLGQMVDHGCVACVMECSSHALEQGRCDGLTFDTAVFTNLSGDHLDYHGSMDAYAQAKAKLFAMATVCWVNGDEQASTVMAAAARGRVLRYGMESHHDLCGQIVSMTAAGCDIDLVTGEVRQRVTLPMLGRHNVVNLLSAIGGTCGETVALEGIAPVVSQLSGAPGRLERVTSDDAPFTVLVDYAHTDDALRYVLEALRPLIPKDAALRVLFGCGGDRDATKRPRMGAVASRLADAIVITSDNPRTEDPAAIIEQIAAGVEDQADATVTIIPDRRQAIRRILTDAQPGDVILLAGKGHEDYQIIGNTRHPFDDRVEARRVLAETESPDTTRTRQR